MHFQFEEIRDGTTFLFLTNQLILFPCTKKKKKEEPLPPKNRTPKNKKSAAFKKISQQILDEPTIEIIYFEPNIEIIFCLVITTTNNPSLKIYCKNIIRMLWIRFLVETNPSIDIYIYIYILC